MTNEFIPASNGLILPVARTVNPEVEIIQPPRARLNLMLDMGDSLIDPRTDPRMDVEPESRGPRHAPTTHAEAYESIHDAFQFSNLDIVQEVCALDKKGFRFFGLVELASQHSDYSHIMAYRWAQDQKLARVLAGGNGVWICSNLCIGGKIVVRKKQTTNMREGLVGAYIDGIAEVLGFNVQQDRMLASYREAQITKQVAYAAITHMVRDGIINLNQFNTVVDQWLEPEHDDHAQYGDSVWKLWNAVTHAYKPSGSRSIQDTLCDRSPKLMKFMNFLVANKSK